MCTCNTNNGCGCSCGGHMSDKRFIITKLLELEAAIESSVNLELGETSTTAYRGDRGKTAYDHSNEEGNPHNTLIADIPNLGNELSTRATIDYVNNLFDSIPDPDLTNYVTKNTSNTVTSDFNLNFEDVEIKSSDNIPNTLSIQNTVSPKRITDLGAGFIKVQTNTDAESILTATSISGQNHLFEQFELTFPTGKSKLSLPLTGEIMNNRYLTTSVNGVFANENGDVVLEIPDLSGYVRKNGINTVGDTNPFGLHTSGLEMELTQTDFRLIDRDLNNNQILIDPTQGSLTVLTATDSKLELDRQQIRWFHANGGYSRLRQADAGFLSELKFPNSDRSVNTIPISVNGVFADKSGNIIIPTGGDTSQFVVKNAVNILDENKNTTFSGNNGSNISLNSVTDTDINLTVQSSIFTSPEGTYEAKSIIEAGYIVADVRLNSAVISEVTINAEGAIYLSRDAVGSVNYNVEYIQTEVNGKTNPIFFPKWVDDLSNRRFTVSVNGVLADEFGNVTIPTGDSVELGSGLHEGADGKINLGRTDNDGEEGLLTRATTLMLIDESFPNFNSSLNFDYRSLNLVHSTDEDNLGVYIDSNGLHLSRLNRAQDLFQDLTFKNSTNGSSIVLTDEINNKGIVYAADYSANFTDHSLVTKKFVLDNAGGSLQSVTTGAGNNVTSNAIQVTGADETDVTVNSLLLFHDETAGSVLGRVKDGNIIGQLQIAETELQLRSGLSSLNLQVETAIKAGAEFATRVKGSNAQNSDEFVTKAQLDKSTIVEIDNTTINLSKADLNTDFPLATYPIGTQVFCPEISTKYTRVYDDIWVSELFSEVL